MRDVQTECAAETDDDMDSCFRVGVEDEMRPAPPNPTAPLSWFSGRIADSSFVVLTPPGTPRTPPSPERPSYDIITIPTAPTDHRAAAALTRSTSPVNRANKIVAKWHMERDASAQQLVGVLRHTERADSSFALVDGGMWHHLEDSKKFPFDPPLSDKGIEAARKIGESVQRLARDCDTEMHSVVSSPFLRCIQTAVEVCAVLGPSCRLLVDCTLGEVYGPSVMGQLKPEKGVMVRTMESVLDLCKKRGVSCEPQLIGHWRKWPELMPAARRRFAKRFLTYLRRSVRVRRNFLIVTHADCVGAALSMMPSEVGSVVEKIEFGGMFLAQRLLQSRRTWSRRTRRYMEPASAPEVSVRTIPSNSAVEGNSKTSDEPCPAQETGSIERKRADSKGSDEEHFDNMSTGSRDEICSEARKSVQFEAKGVSQASDGWRVQHHGIKHTESKNNAAAGLDHRLKGVVDNDRFSRPLIEQLLVENMSDLPLASEDRGCGLSADAIAEERKRVLSLRLCSEGSVSLSTLLFGGAPQAEITRLAATPGPYAPRRVFTDVSSSEDVPTNLAPEGCPRVDMSKRSVTLNLSVGDSMMAKRRQAKEKLEKARTD